MIIQQEQERNVYYYDKLKDLKRFKNGNNEMITVGNQGGGVKVRIYKPNQDRKLWQIHLHDTTSALLLNAEIQRGVLNVVDKGDGTEVHLLLDNIHLGLCRKYVLTFHSEGDASVFFDSYVHALEKNSKGNFSHEPFVNMKKEEEYYEEEYEESDYKKNLAHLSPINKEEDLNEGQEVHEDDEKISKESKYTECVDDEDNSPSIIFDEFDNSQLQIPGSRTLSPDRFFPTF